jgi:hypothetical protein
MLDYTRPQDNISRSFPPRPWTLNVELYIQCNISFPDPHYSTVRMYITSPPRPPTRYPSLYLIVILFPLMMVLVILNVPKFWVGVLLTRFPKVRNLLMVGHLQVSLMVLKYRPPPTLNPQQSRNLCRGNTEDATCVERIHDRSTPYDLTGNCTLNNPAPVPRLNLMV